VKYEVSLHFPPESTNVVSVSRSVESVQFVTLSKMLGSYGGVISPVSNPQVGRLLVVPVLDDLFSVPHMGVASSTPSAAYSDAVSSSGYMASNYIVTYRGLRDG
jgi:hypothetical protein